MQLYLKIWKYEKCSSFFLIEKYYLSILYASHVPNIDGDESNILILWMARIWLLVQKSYFFISICSASSFYSRIIYNKFLCTVYTIHKTAQFIPYCLITWAKIYNNIFVTFLCLIINIISSFLSGFSKRRRVSYLVSFIINQWSIFINPK